MLFPFQVIVGVRISVTDYGMGEVDSCCPVVCSLCSSCTPHAAVLAVGAIGALT